MHPFFLRSSQLLTRIPAESEEWAGFNRCEDPVSTSKRVISYSILRMEAISQHRMSSSWVSKAKVSEDWTISTFPVLARSLTWASGLRRAWVTAYTYFFTYSWRVSEEHKWPNSSWIQQSLYMYSVPQEITAGGFYLAHHWQPAYLVETAFRFHLWWNLSFFFWGWFS